MGPIKWQMLAAESVDLALHAASAVCLLNSTAAGRFGYVQAADSLDRAAGAAGSAELASAPSWSQHVHEIVDFQVALRDKLKVRALPR